MLILNSPEVMQETCLRWKKDHTIAFVPTMGCLHEGHLELVKTAKTLGTKVIVSIFVNPLQFGPNEDFDKYPRSFEADVERLEQLNVDLLFRPDVHALYPEGFSSKLEVGEIGSRLCGKFRPGHFNGVATVVLKLFEISACDFAIFGEKDFQQLQVIKQITSDFNLPVGIVPHKTVRAGDGLALSSRNNYLNPEERRLAALIPQALNQARNAALETPEIGVTELLQQATKQLNHPLLKIQYLEVTQGRSLMPVLGTDKISGLNLPHLFVAVYAGSTRLIDNISLNGVH